RQRLRYSRRSGTRSLGKRARDAGRDSGGLRLRSGALLLDVPPADQLDGRRRIPEVPPRRDPAPQSDRRHALYRRRGETHVRGRPRPLRRDLAAGDEPGRRTVRDREGHRSPATRGPPGGTHPAAPAAGMTMIDKILARHAGVDRVAPGEIVVCDVDMAVRVDLEFSIAGMELEPKRIADPERVAVILDHAVPAPTIGDAAGQARARAFAKRFGIARFYDVGNHGICHQVILESGL